MTAIEVFTRQNEASLAMVRSVASVWRDVRMASPDRRRRVSIDEARNHLPRHPRGALPVTGQRSEDVRYGAEAAPVVLLEKACTRCGVVKPLSEFHRNRTKPDGHRSECAECANAYAAKYLAEERERDLEGLRRRTRQATDRHRRRTGNARGKALDAARRRAINELIEAHREEFEKRYRIAKHDAGLASR